MVKCLYVFCENSALESRGRLVRGRSTHQFKRKQAKFLNETKVLKFKIYQLGVHLCDKRIIPRHIKSRLNIHFREVREKKEANIHFVDNIHSIPIDDNLYKDSVHLNEKGKQILAENLKNAIREAYAQSALHLGCDWKVTSTPK